MADYKLGFTGEEVDDLLGRVNSGKVAQADKAAVGQTIVVKAVDENGKPTEWEAADMPSGGGSGSGLDIFEYTLSDTSFYNASELTGKYPELFEKFKVPGVYFKLTFRDGSILQGIPTVMVNGDYWYVYFFTGSYHDLVYFQITWQGFFYQGYPGE